MGHAGSLLVSNREAGENGVNTEYGWLRIQTWVTNWPQTVLWLKLKVPHPRSPLSPGQTETVSTSGTERGMSGDITGAPSPSPASGLSLASVFCNQMGPDWVRNGQLTGQEHVGHLDQIIEVFQYSLISPSLSWVSGWLLCPLPVP